MAMSHNFRSYCDESEDKDGNVHVVGGFIGEATEWDRLEEKWIARIKPAGISAFHMTDCNANQGEFSKEKGWTKQDCTQLTIDLIGLINQHNIFMYGVGVLLHDYRAIPPVNDEGMKLGKDKWHMTFQSLLHDLALAVEPFDKEETIGFFFDWRAKQGAADDIFKFTQEDSRLGDWRKRLGTLTFGHKEFDVPGSIPLLQVADIAAVEAQKKISIPITHPHLGERRSFIALREAKRVMRVSCFNKAVLEIMYELKREELGLPNNAHDARAKLEAMKEEKTKHGKKF